MNSASLRMVNNDIAVLEKLNYNSREFIAGLNVTAVSREQLTGTVATISCIVAGLMEQPADVNWTKSDYTDITSGQDGYTIDVGTLSGDSQTTTLTVAADQNTQDTTYNCVVTSNEHDVKDKSTTVNLKVFSKSFMWIDSISSGAK